MLAHFIYTFLPLNHRSEAPPSIPNCFQDCRQIKKNVILGSWSV